MFGGGLTAYECSKRGGVKMKNPIGMHLLGLVLMVLLLEGGCSTDPVYRTEYQLTQPASIAGRQCVTQCETNRMLCIQNKREEQTQCETRAKDEALSCKQQARQDYSNCMRTASHTGNYRASTESNCRSILQSSSMQCDNRYSRCDMDSSACDRSYRGCFSNCGGQVDKQVRCVANCDKQK